MGNKHNRYLLLFLSFAFFLSVSLYAQQQAKPKAGEGLSSFLLRHNRSPKKYHADFIQLNKGKLGKNETLRLDVTYTIPPVKSSSGSSRKSSSKNKTSKKESSKSKAIRRKSVINEPLFGKKHSRVKVTSRRLEGACFYVVSGHGGPDPGAIGHVGKQELHEDEYAYDIALRLAHNLMQEGAEVHIVIQDGKDGIRDEAYLSNSKRETCMGQTIPLNQVARLKQRCQAINTRYRKDRKNYTYCRAIFIHVDSRGKGKQTDVFFYHSNRKSDSKRLANAMKETFETKYDKHQPNRGFSGTVSGRNLFVLANTTPASVFVELGNIQNTFDQKRLVISTNREALSRWLMDGFIKDFNKKK